MIAFPALAALAGAFPAPNPNKMKDETQLALKGAFKQAVREQVKANGGTRWGEKESLAVIQAVVEAFASDDDAMTEGFGAIAEHIAKVVNPSAFAQKLESLPADHPAHITRAKKGAKKGLDV